MTQSKDETNYDVAFKSLKDVKLSDQEKSDIHVKMMGSVEKSNHRKINWDIRPIFNTILAGILLFLGGYFLVNEVIFSEEGRLGHGNEELQTPYVEIEKELSDGMQTPIYIPYHEELPMKLAMFLMNNKWDTEGKVTERKPQVATIVYSDLEADQADAAEFEQITERRLPSGYEAAAPFEVVFGDFLKTEKSKASITVLTEELSPKELIDSVTYGGEKITIAEHRVTYKVVDSGPPLDDKLYLFSFKLNNAVYVFTFPVKNVTEEDAYAFVEKSLKQILRR